MAFEPAMQSRAAFANLVQGRHMPFEEHQEEFNERTQRALGMGGLEKLAQRQAQGVLNARERRRTSSILGIRASG